MTPKIFIPIIENIRSNLLCNESKMLLHWMEAKISSCSIGGIEALYDGYPCAVIFCREAAEKELSFIRANDIRMDKDIVSTLKTLAKLNRVFLDYARKATDNYFIV